MFSKFKNCLIPLLLSMQLSSCVVINSVDAVKPSDNFAMTDDRTVIFFSVKVEGDSQTQQVSNTRLNRFIPGSKKLTASCFFYSYSVANASVKKDDFGQRKYFAFKVLPGYYNFWFNETTQTVFKAEARKTNYLGDFTKAFIQHENAKPDFYHAWTETAVLTKDLPAAELAAKNFRSLNWPVSQAEEVEIDGQTEPIPFCTL